jgi:translocon-associated protein subunit delta
MKLFLTLSSLILLFCWFGPVSGDTCTSPEVVSHVYTTSEEQMSSQTVIVVELSLSCKNGLKGLNLYADFNGRTVPASRVLNEDKYQVSFVEEHKKLAAGKYVMRFFDDDLYTDLRKAQRSGEDTAAVKSLFNVEIRHQGTSYGPWIQTEHLAAGLITLVWYFSYVTRSRLQS